MSVQPLNLRGVLAETGLRVTYLTRPARLLRGYAAGNLRGDMLAGLTVAVVLLPQAIVFALIAGLPPQMGLYGAIVGAIVGGLWGSSNQLHTGPSNTSSLLTLSVVSTVAVAGSPEFIAAAGLMAVMVGIFRLLVGMARLGMLANFVSDAVVVGFTTGAGVLIVVGQLKNLLRINIGGITALPEVLQAITRNITDTHLISLGLGLGAVLIILLLNRTAPKAPAPLLAIIIASAVVALFSLNKHGVEVIGELPRGLPPIAHLPLFDLNLLGQLSAGALAVAAIGLVEVTSIARSIAAQTGQRLDSNQEFVGQGLAAIACGIFSSYTPSGSFNRSVVNLQAGAVTPIAGAVSGVVTLLAMLVLGQWAVFIPQAALAGLLIYIAYRMVDRKEMARIWRSNRGDAMIMVITALATLLLPLQFAVLSGILMSLAYYILQTSTPKVINVLPDEHFQHFVGAGERPQCPQTAVIEVRGDLYFGAVNHVEETILDNQAAHPGQANLLLRLNNVQRMDISGVHMLEALVRTYRDLGGDVYMTKLRPEVHNLMQTSGFDRLLGQDHFLDEDTAISHLFYHILDPAVCIYECPLRVFVECQNLPKPTYDHPITHGPLPPITAFPLVSPSELYADLKIKPEMLVIDVREPREFRQGHVPQAQNIPLPVLMREIPRLPRHRGIVLVCRTSRRSRRAAQLLQAAGYQHIRILDQGMVGWETAHLLEAIEPFA